MGALPLPLSWMGIDGNSVHVIVKTARRCGSVKGLCVVFINEVFPAVIVRKRTNSDTNPQVTEVMTSGKPRPPVSVHRGFREIKDDDDISIRSYKNVAGT